MKKATFFLSIVFLLFSGNAHATYSLPAAVVTSWTDAAGLDSEGGIPSASWTQNTCTGVTVGNSASANATALQACIAAAADNTVVYIPAGVYNISGVSWHGHSGVSIQMKSRVVLRGAGANAPWLPSTSSGTTTLNFSGGGHIVFDGDAGGGGWGKDSQWNPAAGTGTEITAGYTRGSSSITVASNSVGYATGDTISIFQDNDSAIIGYSPNGCSWCGEDNSRYHVLQQYSTITSVDGLVYGISPPISYVSPTPTGQMIRKQTNGIKFSGIENIKLDGNAGAPYGIIHMWFSEHCWVKNVETYDSAAGSGNGHIQVWFSYSNEYRDNYIHSGASHDSGSGYGLFYSFWNSGHKIENNIVRDVRHSIVNEGGGSNLSVLYNYTNDNWESVQGSPSTPDTGFLSEDVTANHGPHPHMNLYEGNIMSSLWGDFTMGSSSHITAFRNHIRGERDTPSVTSPWLWTAMEVEKYNRYYNLVGNVAGVSAWTTGTVVWNNSGGATKPYVYRFGCQSPGCGTYGDSLPYSTAIKHGNYDYVTDGVAHWDGGADHALADSLYYGTQPGSGTWWCTETTWPPVNSSTGAVSDIPAKIRYEVGTCTLGADTTPSAFTLTDNTSVDRSTVIYSTPISVTGIDDNTSITSSGTGCYYQVNGTGSWLTTGGDNVSLNDTIQMKTTSSGSYAIDTPCTLTLNSNVADVWHVTTLAAPGEPGLVSTFPPGVTITGGVTIQ